MFICFPHIPQRQERFLVGKRVPLGCSPWQQAHTAAGRRGHLFSLHEHLRNVRMYPRLSNLPGSLNLRGQTPPSETEGMAAWDRSMIVTLLKVLSCVRKRRRQAIDFAVRWCFCERISHEVHWLSTELTLLPPEPGDLFKMCFLNGLLQLCSQPPSFLKASLISAWVEHIAMRIQILHVRSLMPLKICYCTGGLHSQLLTLSYLSIPECIQRTLLPKLSYSGTI